MHFARLNADSRREQEERDALADLLALFPATVEDLGYIT
jgi:hypothetical protein